MNTDSANRDLEFIKRIMTKTHRRIDTHAFHNIHWGIIVFIWFPLANLFQDLGRHRWQIVLGVSAILLGFAMSAFREHRMRKTPRLSGENTFITKQTVLIVYPTVLVGMILSAVAPAFDFIDGSNVPIIWGLIYANMAFMMGVIYTKEFLYSGIAIFVGVIAAIVLQPYNGYILGPFMGLGLIVPGVIAEKRVALMLEEENAEGLSQV